MVPPPHRSGPQTQTPAQPSPSIESLTNRFLTGSFQVAPGPEHKVTAKPYDARITRSRAQFEIYSSANQVCLSHTSFLPLSTINLPNYS